MSDVSDAINPQHYKSHPSGVEAIELAQFLDFCLGNAIKYLFRAGKKLPQQLEIGVDVTVQDLRKAAWYLDRSAQMVKTGHNPCRSLPGDAIVGRVIAAEPEGSVLRDVLTLVVRREPRVMDALNRVEREIEERNQ